MMNGSNRPIPSDRSNEGDYEKNPKGGLLEIGAKFCLVGFGPGSFSGIKRRWRRHCCERKCVCPLGKIDDDRFGLTNGVIILVQT